MSSNHNVLKTLQLKCVTISGQQNNQRMELWLILLKNWKHNMSKNIEGPKYLKWLDSWEPGSVICACLGSICDLATWQLLELGLGLEASSQPFIWVIRGGERSQGLKKWIQEEGFEERTKGR
ncbi:hypothetical protein WN944_006721 [Citrus x changshan-huyou]|uniref:Uncharacterized protein n=1 Tax=Citrus x changshan-huyou TaxID=2935761 RepID=A0AAP0MLJ9_9ROSI